MEPRGTKRRANDIDDAEVDQSTLNRLQARILKAEMTNGDVQPLREEYQSALQKFNSKLAIPQTENISKSVDNTQTPEFKEALPLEPQKNEEDMTVEELAKEERRLNRVRNAASISATQILRDKKFQNTEEYIDENVDRLAVPKHKIDLRNIALKGNIKQGL